MVRRVRTLQIRHLAPGAYTRDVVSNELTVCVGEHYVRALPSQLQGASLEVRLGCRLLNDLSYLKGAEENEVKGSAVPGDVCVHHGDHTRALVLLPSGEHHSVYSISIGNFNMA